MLCFNNNLNPSAEVALDTQIYASRAGLTTLFYRSRGRQQEDGEAPFPPPSSSADASQDGKRGRRRTMNTSQYRSQLEQEVQKLRRQLQEEIDLHVALVNAVEEHTSPLSPYPSKLPDKAKELLAHVAALEYTVSKLEDELSTLHSRLCHERTERQVAENDIKHMASISRKSSPGMSSYIWEEHISSLRVMKFSGSQIPHSCQSAQPITIDCVSDICECKEVSGPCSSVKEGNKVDAPLHQPKSMDLKKTVAVDLYHHPNALSEEMVRCMRDIFLCLSGSSIMHSKLSSDFINHYPYSPVGHLSCSSLMSESFSSIMTPLGRSQTAESDERCEEPYLENSPESCNVKEKFSWINIGSYKLAVEVSWMSVGKTQLDYAADALKRFRLFIEQLAKVNPARMSSNERLAFWINLYNALLMHAYLAYGFPESDIKLFSLMQKASYTVGGQSFSAADIEYVILKMKPPTYRPQLALLLALHNFKISEEHTKYSIDDVEPLLLFALSCGMYSSPALRIFKANNVYEELQNSMRDYIQASTGISDKGKLLVPKLLHSFARDAVEDSLLVDWICRYLLPDQVSVVRDSVHRYQGKERLFGVRSFSIIPFDSRFRYLFLPDNNILHG